MAGETTITVVGNLVDDPDLRFTPSGAAVANFRIASTPRTFDKQSNEWKDGEALFLRASVWREFAEHVAGSLTKGSRVIATGRLKQRSYETKEGEKRTSMELEVDEIRRDPLREPWCTDARQEGDQSPQAEPERDAERDGEGRRRAHANQRRSSGRRPSAIINR